MTTYFITGADGFIGSHLVERLAKDGKVLALTRKSHLSRIPKETLESVELIGGDVTKIRNLERAREADVAIHLAGMTFVPDANADPRHTFEVNLTGTLNMLEASKHVNLKRFIHVSSGQVYGAPVYQPVDEKHPTVPNSVYAASKAAADMLAASYHRAFGMPVAILRLFNVYGPKQSRQFVIPSIITQCLERNELMLGNMKPVRDFTYVDDVVSAIIATIHSNDCAGSPINIGTGRGISIGELAQMLVELTGCGLRPRFESTRFRKVDIPSLVVDNRKAKEMLGWTPKVSLEVGLKRTMEYYREHR